MQKQTHTGVILLAPSFLGVFNFEPLQNTMRWLIFSKNKLSGILSSSPALWFFAGVDLPCSGNYCRCFKGSQSQRQSSDTAWNLLNLCTVCPYILKFSSSPASFLRPCSWQSQKICQRREIKSIYEGLEQEWMLGEMRAWIFKSWWKLTRCCPGPSPIECWYWSQCNILQNVSRALWTVSGLSFTAFLLAVCWNPVFYSLSSTSSQRDPALSSSTPTPDSGK